MGMSVRVRKGTPATISGPYTPNGLPIYIKSSGFALPTIPSNPVGTGVLDGPKKHHVCVPSKKSCHTRRAGACSRRKKAPINILTSSVCPYAYGMVLPIARKALLALKRGCGISVGFPLRGSCHRQVTDEVLNQKDTNLYCPYIVCRGGSVFLRTVEDAGLRRLTTFTAGDTPRPTM